MSMNKPFMSHYIPNESNNYDQFSNYNQNVDVENHKHQFRKKTESGNCSNNLRRHKSNRVNNISDMVHNRALPFNE